jgi:aerobic-type carbon monoxide dehydrogenase small subunit (CoxS/CutS family)
VVGGPRSILLRDNPDPTHDELRAAMSANLCLLHRYARILAAADAEPKPT